VPRESSFTALVIKKQPLGEADEIVTLFSREQGKVRAVSKSSKLSTSKLQYALQPLFLIDATLSGKTSLPKLIRASIVEPYSVLHSHPQRVAIWFVVAELLIRLLPDAAPNEALYESVLQFLSFLNLPQDMPDPQLELGLLKFKLAAMQATGLEIHDISQYDPNKTLLFSPSKGGFYYESTNPGGRGAGADSVAVSEAVWRGLQDLKSADSFNDLPEPAEAAPWKNKLSKLVTDFIFYQLEREIKSEKYL
jgi:DNA repair protein RecO (recombination protein O)